MEKILDNISANQHPHKLSKVKQFIRSFLSLFPLLRKIENPHPNGISVIIRIKNEIDWVNVSLESIKGIADEIIIVDNGSKDGTFEFVKGLEDNNKGLIKVYQNPTTSICDLSNYALKKASFRWILRWDGDMVAHTNGKTNISKLRDRLMALNQKRFFVIYLQHINLKGDLFHQDPKEMVHREEYIHTNSNNAFFVHPGRFEAIKFPKYYKPLFWYEPYCFHLDIKPGRRMLLRYFWEEWMEEKNFGKYPTLDSYVAKHIKKEFGTFDIQEAENLCVQKVCKELIPFKEDYFSPYPEMLKPFLIHPRYQIRYAKGRIIGREEIS